MMKNRLLWKAFESQILPKKIIIATLFSHMTYPEIIISVKLPKEKIISQKKKSAYPDVT